MRFLQSWWSRTYNRPLKDPILLSYTLDELYYEYRDRVEREKAADERLHEETDKIEQAKVDDAMAWADAEEAKEINELDGPEKEPKEWQPSEQDSAWMEEEMRRAKELYGEDFGEDISEDFNG